MRQTISNQPTKYQRAPKNAGKLWFTANFGNRCGHNRLEPIPAPNSLDNRPWLIKKAANNLRRYYDAPEAFPVFWGKRQPRSEQRDSLIAVVSHLLAYCNIATLRIAAVCGPTPERTQGRLYSLSGNDIALALGISTERVYDRLADLELAGWLSAYPRDNGKKKSEKRAYASARYLTPKLFKALGLIKQFNKRRKKAQHELQTALNARSFANPMTVLARALNKFSRGQAPTADELNEVTATPITAEHLAGRSGFKKFADELRRTIKN